ncbi:MAG: mechanosensitive ion channel family protein [Bacteroidales bacterium]|nr:mechanosensitive ion channel family protein [Bacteroidales bacterium]
MMLKKFLLFVCAFLLATAPAEAVLREKNLDEALVVLRGELEQAIKKQKENMARYRQHNDKQKATLRSTMDRCGEVSLMLYSQNQDYVFDLTYACNEATELYRSFQTTNQRPYNLINNRMNNEIKRYDGLIFSLKCLPPALIQVKGKKRIHTADTLSVAAQADRAACIASAVQLRDNIIKSQRVITADSAAFARVSAILERLDAYAKKRYDDIQSSIFRDNGSNYFTILSNFGRNFSRAKLDVTNKYNLGNEHRFAKSQWRGSVIMGFVGFVVFYLVISLVLGFLLVKVLYHYLKRLKWVTQGPEEICVARIAKLQKIRPAIMVALAALIFVGTVMLLRRQLYNNFFIMASHLLIDYACLLVAITFSLLLRLRYNQMSHGFRVYMPMLVLGLVIILFRIVFIPNSVVNLIFPPVVLFFLVWQWRAVRKHTGKLRQSEIIVGEVETDDDEEDDADDDDADLLIEEDEAEERKQERAIRKQIEGLVADDTIVAKGLASALKVRKHEPTQQEVDDPLTNVDQLPHTDRIYAWLSFAVILIATLLTWFGRTLMSVEVVIWWLFQLTAIQTLIAVFRLLDIYEKARLYDRLRDAGTKVSEIAKGLRNGDYVNRTWFFDFVHMAFVPITGAYTLLFSIWMAADVFNLADTCRDIFIYNFIDIPNVIQLSIAKLVVLAAAFFLFRYFNYLFKALFRFVSYRRLRRKTGKEKVRTNEINLTLGYNVIGIIVWGIFVILAFILLKIPKSGISLVTAGLATGIGFAMKDLLNNFFYGISLMAGRLRVGDWIECDGVQGKVESITYQSVQVITNDNCVMSFLNSSLFANNFRNLTRNNSYELIKVPVGVAYGVNVEQVRKVLREAVLSLQYTDKYGRNVMDMNNGHDVLVLFSDFGDSSVNLNVAIWVLVVEKVRFVARVKEVIYQTLQDHNIEIPFPQQDVYIKQLPTQPQKPANQ